MSAYTPGFVQAIQVPELTSSSISGVDITATEMTVITKELLSVPWEILFTTEGDVIEQITGIERLTITAQLTGTSSTGVPVPYVPGAVVDSATGAVVAAGGNLVPVPTPITILNVQKLLTFFDTLVGATGIISHKLLIPDSYANPPATVRCMVYESVNGGVSFTLKPSYAPLISGNRKLTASRASDSSYMSIYIEKALYSGALEIFVTKGTLSGTIESTSYKWTRPYLPVCLACDGTKYVVFAEENRIYTSLDGITWSYKGHVTPALSLVIPPSYTTSAYVLNQPNTFLLQWLPSVSKWCLLGPGVNEVYMTSDPDATTGWVDMSIPLITSDPPGDATFLTSYHHVGSKIVELSGCLFCMGKEDTMYGTSGTFGFTVLKSADGGVTWAVVKRFTPFDMVATGYREYLHSVDVFKGYLVAYVTDGMSIRYKSTDLGATWTAEATNLGMIGAGAYMVLADSVVAYQIVAYGTDIYKYSTDGLTFYDSEMLTLAPDTGAVIVPPPPAADPYAASILLSAAFDKAPTTPGVYWDATYGTISPLAEAIIVFNGYPSDVSMSATLPYRGKLALKTKMTRFSTYAEGTTVYIGFKVPGTSTTYTVAGDYTLEAILACDALGPYLWLSGGTASVKLGSNLAPYGVDVDNGLGVASDPSTQIIVPSSFIPTPLTYHHIAIVRKGVTISLYVDGQLKAEGDQPALYASSMNLTLRGATYIAQFRMTAAARYDGVFTPPVDLLT